MNQAYTFFGAAGSLGYALARRLVKALHRQAFLISSGE